jgi:hypothetical protein
MLLTSFVPLDVYPYFFMAAATPGRYAKQTEAVPSSWATLAWADSAWF